MRLPFAALEYQTDQSLNGHGGGCLHQTLSNQQLEVAAPRDGTKMKHAERKVSEPGLSAKEIAAHAKENHDFGGQKPLIRRQSGAAAPPAKSAQAQGR